MNLNSTNSREIRKFGIIGTIFFVSLFSVAIWRDKTPIAHFFGVLTVLSLGFVLMPVKLKPIYAAWLKVAQFIGSKITILFLTIFYFLVITPAALIKRLFGGRPLPLKPDPKVETYWVTRLESAQPRERFIKRF